MNQPGGKIAAALSEPVKQAAGILFRTPDDRVLLIRRVGSTHAGLWAFPGGWRDGDESREDCARRECLEEVGFDYQGTLVEHARRIDADVDFTTFVANVDDEFRPTLKLDEADAFVWIDRNAAFGLPLHPGDVVPLQKFDMDELALAKAIRDKQITSPQRYANFLLVALRITGTGEAYRSTGDEYTFRDPAIYLTDEFLQRCNGLNVIWKHPPGVMLNSKEFAERIVGNVFLPYISGDEVWGIAKIYDAEAANELATEVLSTSPGVILESSIRFKNAEGDKLLIEGKSRIVDHVAIVRLGVWDKGGPPAGVANDALTTIGELAMADVADDKAKKDSGEGMGMLLDAFKKMDSKLDAMCSRMDSVEGRFAKMDADDKEEKEKADKAKKDAAEMEEKAKKDATEAEEKAKKDAAEMEEKAKKDAAFAAELAELRTRIPVTLTEAERSAYTAAQIKAEKVYQAFGDSTGAPRQLNGEALRDYRIRLASKYKDKSARFSAIDLNKIGDDAAFTLIEDGIYADAFEAAKHPTEAGDVLRMVPETDLAGRRIHRFYGSETAAWSRFASPERRGRINTNFPKH